MTAQLSTTATQLHLCAALESAHTGRTGFVPDLFLGAIEEDVTPAVIELCRSGLWVRDRDGYQIPAHELRRVIEVLQELRQDRAPLR
jgi:hypothetical protein